jgi:bacillithiol system protein YtxJ
MKRLTTIEQVDAMLKDNTDALLFKHSTRCPISARAHEEVERFHEESGLPVGAVHVIEDRAVSDYIAERTGVKHETPQALLWRDGATAWHASHHDVTQQNLRDSTLE